MADVCPNCQKPVLATDTVCWHCGYQLPKRPKTRPSAGQIPAAVTGTPRDRSAAEAGPVDYDFRALVIYGLLTLAVILGLWLVMRSLGRQPILVRSAGPDFGGDWVSVTDVDLRYTLSFPTDWQWLDVPNRDQADLLARLIGNQPHIGRALRPLGDAAGDVEIVGVAVGAQNLEDTDPKPFVVIGRGDRLRDLDPQAALDLLAERSLPVTDTKIDTHLSGQPQARFSLLDNANDYQCRHIVVADKGITGYWVAGCAPQRQFAIFQQDLDDILDSFQILQY